MIKASELRVGNWVIVDYVGDPAFYHRIIPQDIYNNFHESYTAPDWIRPIPLTSELLEKAGFEHEEKEGRMNGINTFHVYTKNDFTFNSNHGWWYNGKQLDIQPKYLHQLQNLYFALTGEELTVNFKELTYQ